MTWMILLAGAVAVGFFGIAYFNEHPGGSRCGKPER